MPGSNSMTCRITMKSVLLFLGASLTTGALHAEPAGENGSLTFYLDNDLFAGSDDGYTNGARLSWNSGNRPVEELRGVHRYLRYLIGDASSFTPFQRLSGFEDASDISYNHGFALTQQMYTPDDPLPYAPIPGQRPYAGVLLLGFSLHAMDENVLNSVGISAGVVGPHAYGEETQDFIHSILGENKLNGWDNQVPDEFLLNLHLEQKRRLPFLDRQRGSLGMDGFTETAIDLGNYLTAARVGAIVRFGYNLPLEFSDPRLSPDAYSHKLFRSERLMGSPWSLYALLGASGSAIAHDVTLDGPWFRSYSSGVDREPFVGEVFAGFGVRYDCWEFSYVHTFRSKAYETQDGTTSFGSLAVRRSF